MCAIVPQKITYAAVLYTVVTTDTALYSYAMVTTSQGMLQLCDKCGDIAADLNNGEASLMVYTQVVDGQDRPGAHILANGNHYQLCDKCAATWEWDQQDLPKVS